MARTTDILVAEIIEVDDTISMTPFISAAYALVTQCCTGLDEDYTSDQLILIETWLAAHFYAIREPRAVREAAGSVSEIKESKVDLGFDVTRYGQMAMRLDWQGGLSRLNKQIKEGQAVSVGITWLGTEEEDLED